MELSRRRFLGASATNIAAVWLGARWTDLRAAGTHAADVTLHSPQAPFETLRPRQGDTLVALTAQIIPTDDLPGAREANVVRFIDRALASFAAAQLPLFQRGVESLPGIVGQVVPGETDFATLGQDDQIAVMQAVEAADPEFFEAVRVATVTGMFANPDYGGNQNKVGWQLIGFVDRFAWQAPFGYYDQEGAE